MSNPGSLGAAPPQQFVGDGPLHGEPWHRSAAVIETDLKAFGHPAGYSAEPGLVDAVNTALLLDKPLLLTGRPGTGKSELAERIAWEFQLGPVERFEAQSLSEAADLFYRFDLVGRMAEGQLADRRVRPLADSLGRQTLADPVDPARFIEFGPLGRAILRAQAEGCHATQRERTLYQRLRYAALAGDDDNAPPPRRSVVLIDEIDKASRDFPNDLLNSIDRTEFRIRELDNLRISAPARHLGLQPIIVITSNEERDLPGPFLRRCAFHHIPDPQGERLARIVRNRVFPELGPGDKLPPLFHELLGFFEDFQQQSAKQLTYTPGTTELLDVSQALRRRAANPAGSLASQLPAVRAAMSLLAKHRDDAEHLKQALMRRGLQA